MLDSIPRRWSDPGRNWNPLHQTTRTTLNATVPVRYAEPFKIWDPIDTKVSLPATIKDVLTGHRSLQRLDRALSESLDQSPVAMALLFQHADSHDNSRAAS